MSSFACALIGDLEPRAEVWRYLTFPKFVSVVATRALWFSKLDILSDKEEGTFPRPSRIEAKRKHREMEEWFDREELRSQVRQFVERNEEDGRELIVVSCWSLGRIDCVRMWSEYTGNGNTEGVAVRSTAQELVRALNLNHDMSWIGRVRYVDRRTFAELSMLEANQAHTRAFIKSSKFSWESECRVATMNFVSPGCLNPDGSIPNKDQQNGLVYSPDRPGILVTCHLPTLVKEVRCAPGATVWHRQLVQLLVRQAGIQCEVTESLVSGRRSLHPDERPSD